MIAILFADHLRYVVMMSIMVAGSLLTRVTLTLSPHVLITTIAVIGIAHYTLMCVDKARLRVDKFLHCVEFIREWKSAVDFLRARLDGTNLLDEWTAPVREDEVICIDMSNHEAVTGYTEGGMLFIKIKVTRKDEDSDDGNTESKDSSDHSASDSGELSDRSDGWDVSEFFLVTNYNEKRKWEAVKVVGKNNQDVVEVDLVPYIEGLFKDK
jgi:hypothetical protein